MPKKLTPEDFERKALVKKILKLMDKYEITMTELAVEQEKKYGKKDEAIPICSGESYVVGYPGKVF